MHTFIGIVHMVYDENVHFNESITGFRIETMHVREGWGGGLVKGWRMEAGMAKQHERKLCKALWIKTHKGRLTFRWGGRRYFICSAHFFMWSIWNVLCAHWPNIYGGLHDFHHRFWNSTEITEKGWLCFAPCWLNCFVLMKCACTNK